MGSLFTFYITLTVFGLGVTVVDFLGIFDHAGSGADGHFGGGDAGSEAADDAGFDAGDSGDNGDTLGDAAGFTADGGHAAHGVTDHGGIAAYGDADHGGAHNGSQLGSPNAGVRVVTGLMGALRTVVYFALGAGPTGLFALLTGRGILASLGWSAAVGGGIAILTRLLRKFIRRDLDSSIKPDELLMERAVILVPVSPGEVGKAAVRQFGVEQEVYVRCRDEKAAFPRGAQAVIVDFDESIYWIEPCDSLESRE